MKDSSDQDGEWMSMASAGQRAGGYQRVWRMVQGGSLPSRKVGARTQVLRRSVDALVRRSAPIDEFASPVPAPVLGQAQRLLDLKRQAAIVAADLEDECVTLEHDGHFADASLLREFIRAAACAGLEYDPERARWRVVPADSHALVTA